MNIFTYYRLAKEELLKVIFPTKDQIRNALISIVIVVAVITLFLALIDFVLSVSISSIL